MMLQHMHVTHACMTILVSACFPHACLVTCMYPVTIALHAATYTVTWMTSAFSKKNSMVYMDGTHLRKSHISYI